MVLDEVVKRAGYRVVQTTFPIIYNRITTEYIRNKIKYVDDAGSGVVYGIENSNSFRLLVPNALKPYVDSAKCISDIVKIVRPVVGKLAIMDLCRHVSRRFGDSEATTRLLAEALVQDPSLSLSELRQMRRKGVWLSRNDRLISYIARSRCALRPSQKLKRIVQQDFPMEAMLLSNVEKGRAFYEKLFEVSGLPFLKFKSFASIRSKYPTPFSMFPVDAPAFDSSELVTVIMPAYSAAMTIDYAVQSILNQTYRSIELIIVVDGNDRATFEKATRFSKKDNRVSVVCNATLSGASYCRNIGLKAANGYWVTFQDADDWAHPLRIARHVETCKSRNTIAAVSSQIRVNQDGVFQVRPNGRLVHLNMSSLLFRRKTVIDQIGYPYNSEAGADEEYFERIKLHFGSQSVARVKELLSVALWHASSLTGSLERGNESGFSLNSRLSFYCGWLTAHKGAAVRVGLDACVPLDTAVAKIMQSDAVLQRQLSVPGAYSQSINVRSINGYAERLQTNGNWSMLRVACEAILRFDPGNKKAWRWLGQSHGHLKDWSATLKRTDHLHHMLTNGAWLEGNSHFARLALSRAQALWANGSVKDALNLASVIAQAVPTQLHIRTAMLWNLLLVNSGVAAAPGMRELCELGLEKVESDSFSTNHQFCHTLVEAAKAAGVELDADGLMRPHIAVRPELALALANRSMDDDSWLSFINEYTVATALTPISLSSGTAPRFQRLTATRPLDRSGPLISVIMSAFNVEDYIGLAAHSVLSQTWRDVELIIVEDQGTDRTWEYILELSRLDSRVVPLRNGTNSGTYLSRNRAASIARGEFITCNDSDDWSHPERLQRQVEPLLSDQTLVATFSHMLRVTDDGYFPLRAPGRYSRHNASSLMVRKAAVQQRLGFWDNVRVGADSEFISRLYAVFGREATRTLPEIMMLCNHRATSLSRDPDVGVNANGISDARARYRASYLAWHETLGDGADPFIAENVPPHERPFAAPAEILRPRS